MNEARRKSEDGSNPLDGSFRKINWARSHLRSLDAFIEGEVRSQSYQLSHEVNPEAGRFEIVWDPPPLDAEFGLRIGALGAGSAV